jgi:hypothetical protein
MDSSQAGHLSSRGLPPVAYNQGSPFVRAGFGIRKTFERFKEQ